MIDSQADKATLRQYFRAQRAVIPTVQREAAGIYATQQLIKHACFTDHQTFGCYVPFGAEFDTWPIIHAILHANKRCYLPVLDTLPKTMHFVRYDHNALLHKNTHGILEPAQPINSGAEIAITDLSVIIMPLLAFDRAGHRLGLGAGYYDKALSFLKNNVLFKTKPFLLGVAFACQEADSLPHDPWDIPLNAILTENGFIYC